MLGQPNTVLLAFHQLQKVKKERDASPISQRMIPIEAQANAVPAPVREYIVNESDKVIGLIDDAKEHERQIHGLLDKFNQSSQR